MEASIGEKVAASLEVALDEPQRRTISARPSENFEAYSYYLQGEAVRTGGVDALQALPRAIAMYEKAVALDPKFALAFARLSLTHGDMYWSNIDRTAKRLAPIRPAAEKAVQLAPDLPEARLAMGMYYYRALRDWDRALGEFSAGLRGQPGNPQLLGARAAVLRRQGRFLEAAANYARYAELDPRSSEAAFSLAGTSGVIHNYPNAVRYAERTLALSPRRRLTAGDFNGDTSEFLVWKADWARRHGGTARSLTLADSARITLERRVAADPAEARTRMLLALGYALPGRKADALREAARAAEILPVSRDAWDGADLQQDMAYVETLVGEHDAAIKRLAYLLTIPSELSVPFLRTDPMWDPLRGNPHFQQLIAAPR